MTNSYTVRQGDTLGQIANTYKVPVNSLSGYKSGNPNLIYPGEHINLPNNAANTSTPSGPVYTPMPTPKPQPNFSSLQPSASAGLSPTLPTPQRQPATTQPSWLSQQTKNISNTIVPPAYAAESPKPPQTDTSITKPNPGIPDWAWNQVVEGAKQSAKKYGIPASVTIAQFLQETGGNPAHFIGGTNVFGVKGTGPAGTTTLPTTEYINGVPQTVYANFAKYNNISEAVEQHGKNLANNPAYGKLQGLITKGNNNPYDIANALQGIYATDPEYAKKLQNLITTYGLAHADDYKNYPIQNELTEVKKQARNHLDKNSPTKSGTQTQKYPTLMTSLPPGVVSPISSPADIAISRIRKAKPHLTLSDAQIRDLYSRYGERLLSELPKE